MDEPAPPLDYAPPPPIYRRRRWRVGLALGAVTIFAAAAPAWVPPAWQRVRLLVWQRECLAYSAPPAAVAVDADRPSTGVVPAEWSSFYTAATSAGLRSGGTVFLHALRDPRGRERLVAVDLQRASHAFLSEILVPRVFEPAGLLSPAREHPCPTALGFEPSLSTPTLYHPGQIDPADPSHFTIAYTSPIGPGVLDGWLREDQTVFIARRGEEAGR